MRDFDRETPRCVLKNHSCWAVYPGFQRGLGLIDVALFFVSVAKGKRILLERLLSTTSERLRSVLAAAMREWKRVFFGDDANVWKNRNYYRDIVLLWPFSIFCLVGIAHLAAPDSPHERVLGYKLIVLGLMFLLFAKQKVIVFLVAVALTAGRLAFSLVLGHVNAAVLLLLTACVGVLVAVFCLRRDLLDPKGTYKVPSSMTVFEMVLMGCSIAATMMAFDISRLGLK